MLKSIVAIGWIAFSWLFVMMTALPVIRKRKEKANVRLHSAEKPLELPAIPVIRKVAVALDFSDNDQKLIAYALAQQKGITILLLHIVETAQAKFYGNPTTTKQEKDQQQLDGYAAQLTAMGYQVQVQLGFQSRVREIVRIVTEANADMLVMGAHRHTGIKDYIYGETVDQVRHKLTIPVLIAP